MGLIVRAGNMSQSCSPDKTHVWLTPCHSSTEFGAFCKEIQKWSQKSYKRPHYAPNSG